MPEFIYQEPFPVGEDTTEYRLLTKDYVKVVECDGRKILKVDPKGLEELSKAAYSDVSFYLRASHLQKLRNILEDSEASDNDRFVAYTMLLNQCVAAEGELPTCQDTGTAICIGHKGEDVYTGADDAEHIARGVYETYKDDPERYVDYLRHLHLDRTVGLEEFGAVAPIFPAPGMKIWYPDVSIVNMGYGYAIELTPLHTLTLYNAVANDGCMVAPRLVREIRRGGEVVERPERRVLVDKICSSSALRKVRECLEEVGTTGTAKQFFRDTTLFKIAGKTGTAQFAQDGIKYSDGYYLGTMVLYFPADEPKYTVLTAMFTRRGRGTTYYGAGLSGPVEQQIVNYIYNRQREWYGRVEETDDAHYARTVKGGDIAQIREAAGELMPRVVSERRSGWGRTRVDSLGRVTVTPLADDPHTMPDVRGMGLKEAVFLLESRGLRVAFTGKGAVREQTLPPGAKIQRGQTVTLKLR